MDGELTESRYARRVRKTGCLHLFQSFWVTSLSRCRRGHWTSLKMHSG